MITKQHQLEIWKMALVLRAKQASQESLRYLILSLLAFSAQVNQVKVAEHSCPVKFVLFITKNIIFKKEKAHFLHLHKYMLIALLLWPQALPALGHLALLLRPLHTNLSNWQYFNMCTSSDFLLF